MKFHRIVTTTGCPVRWVPLAGPMGFFIILFLFTCLLPAKAAAVARTLFLNAEQGRFELGPYLEIMEDKNRQWTIEEVSSPAFSHKFKPLNARTLNLGLTSSAIWIRFSMAISQSGSDRPFSNSKWYLDCGRDFLENGDLYIPVDEEKPELSKKRWLVIGSNRQATSTEKHLAHLPFEFDLPQKPAVPRTVYLRVQHPAALYLPLVIFSGEAYLSHLKKVKFWQGIYFGAIIAMFLFNLFVYAALRERISFFYLLYISSAAIYFLFYNGIVFQYVLSDHYRLHQILHSISLGFTIFWGVCFAKNFLVTKEHSKTVDKLLLAIMVAAGAFITFSPSSNLALLNQVSSILGMISPLVIILAAVICWRRGFRPILFFLIAWTVLSIGGLVFALTYRGVLPYATITISSFQIGSGLEVVILSFALAHRVRILRRERKRIIDMFGKYVAREVRDEILNKRIPLDGEIKEVTLLFADLRDFTKLVESSPPKEVVRIINCYFTEMAEAIHLHKGLVLQFIGDEIEAVFGAPLTLDNHPRLAVQTALEMRQRLERVNQNLKSRNYPLLRHGIGIHTGQVLAANIGSLDRLSYALVGDSVNVASRIQEQTKKYQTDILISASTESLLGQEFNLYNLDLTTLKGKSEPIRLFALK
jgi:class 3 adenylate cyclase